MPNALRPPRRLCWCPHTRASDSGPWSPPSGFVSRLLRRAARKRKTKNVSARPRPAQAQGVLLCESTENCSPRLWQPRVTRSLLQDPASGSLLPLETKKARTASCICQGPCQPGAHVPRPAFARKATSAQESWPEEPLSFHLSAPFRGGSRVSPHRTSSWCGQSGFFLWDSAPQPRCGHTAFCEKKVFLLPLVLRPWAWDGP